MGFFIPWSDDEFALLEALMLKKEFRNHWITIAAKLLEEGHPRRTPGAVSQKWREYNAKKRKLPSEDIEIEETNDIAVNIKKWTKGEDVHLLDLIEANNDMKTISIVLARTPEACRDRYQYLEKQRKALKKSSATVKSAQTFPRKVAVEIKAKKPGGGVQIIDSSMAKAVTVPLPSPGLKRKMSQQTSRAPPTKRTRLATPISEITKDNTKSQVDGQVMPFSIDLENDEYTAAETKKEIDDHELFFRRALDHAVGPRAQAICKRYLAIWKAYANDSIDI